MLKRYIVIPAMLLAAALALSGCFGSFAPQPTPPPEKQFSSVEAFAAAVAASKADLQAADEVDLKGLTGYYVPKALPDGAVLSYIKVSTVAVRFGYTFGPTTEESYDNQMEFGFYRKTKTSTYLSDLAGSMISYNTVSTGGIDYLHTVPDIQFIVTPSPGDTAAATPTPRTDKFCQFVYWVQDNACFFCAMPLGFTNDDIGKYCQCSRVELADTQK